MLECSKSIGKAIIERTVLTMICLNCGKAIDDDLKVCPFCGNLIEADDKAPSYTAGRSRDLPDTDPAPDPAPEPDA